MAYSGVGVGCYRVAVGSSLTDTRERRMIQPMKSDSSLCGINVREVTEA
jgi:hypothetical protein